ncbi:cyclic pyranopterin monophosphate synthase-like [Littorina saxatilis]|uniref:cyclic pyranopterin monophosphate synthase-like n=1 Tax=Littorina saxatilis TaxID=31220 RepID=UPI0038B497C5
MLTSVYNEIEKHSSPPTLNFFPVPVLISENPSATHLSLSKFSSSSLLHLLRPQQFCRHHTAFRKFSTSPSSLHNDHSEQMYWETLYRDRIQEKDSENEVIRDDVSERKGKGDDTSDSEEQSLKLTHTDDSGRAEMVDVGEKSVTTREARAQAKIWLGAAAFTLVQQNKMKKGDVLTVAQLAGIMAAKKTSDLIPLCHNILLTKVDVKCSLNEEDLSVVIEAMVRTRGVTGVEMEALTAVSVAALTVYDMCKAVTREMVISDVKLVMKTGGARGDYFAK